MYILVLLILANFRRKDPSCQKGYVLGFNFVIRDTLLWCVCWNICNELKVKTPVVKSCLLTPLLKLKYSTQDVRRRFLDCAVICKKVK